MLKAEYYTRNKPRIFVQFDDLLSNPVDLIRSVEMNFRMHLKYSPESERAINEFLDPGLKHHKDEQKSTTVFPEFEIDHLYELFYGIHNGDITHLEENIIDAIRTNFYEKVVFYNKMCELSQVIIKKDAVIESLEKQEVEKNGLIDERTNTVEALRREIVSIKNVIIEKDRIIASNQIYLFQIIHSYTWKIGMIILYPFKLSKVKKIFSKLKRY